MFMSPNRLSRRRPRRQLLPLLALTVAGSLLAGCAGPGGAAADDEPVVVATDEFNVTDMTPGMSQGSNIDYALFTPLTRFDPESGDVVDVVAESFTTEDQRRWRIKLRAGWAFHDGTPVTAQSFADSWNMTADPANAMTNNASMAVFEGYDAMNPTSGEPTADTLSGVRVVDDRTLDVTTDGPNRLLPFVLSATTFAPMTPEAAADPEAFARAPVGNGPFSAPEGGWELGDQEIVLERFEEYGGTAAGLAEVDLRVYQGPESVYTDYQAGQLDVAFLEGDQLTTAAAEVPESVVEVPLPALLYLGFPLDDDRFADLEMRRAFSLAVDRESIAGDLLDGNAEAATSLGREVLVGAGDVECGSCSYDPDAARDALEAAGGWEGPLVLQTFTDPTNERVLQAVANQVRDNLGIDAEIDTVPIGQLYESLGQGGAEGPFLLYAGTAYPHVYASASALLASGGELNVTGFSEDGVDDALGDTRASGSDTDAALRAAEAAELGLEEIPLTPLVFPTAGIVASDRVGGVAAEFFGAPRLDALEPG